MLQTADFLDKPVQSLEKLRSIPFCKGRRAAGDGAGAAKIRQQITGGQCSANVVFCIYLAGRCDDAGFLPETLRSERDISSDHDIIFLTMGDDPLIGGVTLTIYNNLFNAGIGWKAQGRIGYEYDVPCAAFRNFVNFCFNRACIGIDPYLQHQHSNRSKTR